MIAELDGMQHFKNVSVWKNPELTRTTDVYKMKLAVENGITVLRILQEDVYYDRIDWQTILLDAIKVYDTPQIIYLSDESIYEDHRGDYMDFSIEELASKIEQLKLQDDSTTPDEDESVPIKTKTTQTKPSKTKLKTMDLPSLIELATLLGKEDASEYKAGAKVKNKTI